MSKLDTLRKQISALEAEYAKAAKAEMAAAVGKVRSLMDSLGVTLEHLGGKIGVAVGNGKGSRKVAVKKVSAKRAGAGVAKYRDPASGKTWTGFGRAPAWIQNSENRDAFLVGADGDTAVSNETARGKRSVNRVDAEKGGTRSVTAAKKVRKVKKVKATAKKATTAVAKKAAAKRAPAKKTAVKKTVAKKVAVKKVVAKKAASAKASRKSASKGGTAVLPAPAAAPESSAS